MTPRVLPEFIPPMLAKLATPFDSDEFIFEVKWDGTRGIVFRDGDGYRLLNRRRVDMTATFPELDFLERLPPGTVLDGEVVVMHEGRPDFGLLQSRVATRSALKRRTLARTTPATFVVFDQLYEQYASVMDRVLEARKAGLERTVKKCAHPSVVVSEGLQGSGLTCFEEVCRRGLEGLVAKRLGSRYHPGQRTDSWLKLKRRQTLICAIVGFVPSGFDDFKSLILASDRRGELRCVGRVGSGISTEARGKLNEILHSRLCEIL